MEREVLNESITRRLNQSIVEFPLPSGHNAPPAGQHEYWMTRFAVEAAF
jgi:hypothetical protein